jgi:hypothetical protein
MDRRRPNVTELRRRVELPEPRLLPMDAVKNSNRSSPTLCNFQCGMGRTTGSTLVPGGSVQNTVAG